MAKIDLNRSTLDDFAERVKSLDSESQRLWGEMDVVRMLRHLVFTVDMSLGNVEVESFTPKFARPLIYLLAFNWFTNWPKGKLKAPDWVCPDPEGDFLSERDLLLSRLGEFVDILETDPQRTGVNPGLGSIPMTRWSRVHGIHTDHHLRQFGV